MVNTYQPYPSQPCFRIFRFVHFLKVQFITCFARCHFPAISYVTMKLLTSYFESSCSKFPHIFGHQKFFVYIFYIPFVLFIKCLACKCHSSKFMFLVNFISKLVMLIFCDKFCSVFLWLLPGGLKSYFVMPLIGIILWYYVNLFLFGFIIGMICLC